MTPEGGCGEDAGGIPCPHVLVSFALPPAALFVFSDTDLFHPTPWGLDRGRHLPQLGSISPINLRLRLKGAHWVCWLFELMINKVQVCRILRKVENESPMERESKLPYGWFPSLVWVQVPQEFWLSDLPWAPERPFPLQLSRFCYLYPQNKEGLLGAERRPEPGG